MSQVQELLERNKSGISSHQPIPTLREGAALGMKPPATLIRKQIATLGKSTVFAGTETEIFQ